MKPCTCPVGDCLPACYYCRDQSIYEPCPHAERIDEREEAAHPEG